MLEVLLFVAAFYHLFVLSLSDSPKSQDVKSSIAKCEEAMTPSKKETERRTVATRPDVIPKSPATPSPQNKKGKCVLYMF